MRKNNEEVMNSAIKNSTNIISTLNQLSFSEPIETFLNMRKLLEIIEEFIYICILTETNDFSIKEKELKDKIKKYKDGKIRLENQEEVSEFINDINQLKEKISKYLHYQINEIINFEEEIKESVCLLNKIIEKYNEKNYCELSNKLKIQKINFNEITFSKKFIPRKNYEIIKKYSIEERVLNNTFKIPFFQRKFTWTSKEINSLIDAINESDGVKEKFDLGIISLSEDDEIIDGQQRLHSIYIIGYFIGKLKNIELIENMRFERVRSIENNWRGNWKELNNYLNKSIINEDTNNKNELREVYLKIKIIIEEGSTNFLEKFKNIQLYVKKIKKDNQEKFFHYINSSGRKLSPLESIFSKLLWLYDDENLEKQIYCLWNYYDYLSIEYRLNINENFEGTISNETKEWIIKSNNEKNIKMKKWIDKVVSLIDNEEKVNKNIIILIEILFNEDELKKLFFFKSFDRNLNKGVYFLINNSYDRIFKEKESYQELINELIIKSKIKDIKEQNYQIFKNLFVKNNSTDSNKIEFENLIFNKTSKRYLPLFLEDIIYKTNRYFHVINKYVSEEIIKTTKWLSLIDNYILEEMNKDDFDLIKVIVKNEDKRSLFKGEKFSINYDTNMRFYNRTLIWEGKIIKNDNIREINIIIENILRFFNNEIEIVEDIEVLHKKALEQNLFDIYLNSNIFWTYLIDSIKKSIAQKNLTKEECNGFIEKQIKFLEEWDEKEWKPSNLFFFRNDFESEKIFFNILILIFNEIKNNDFENLFREYVYDLSKPPFTFDGWFKRLKTQEWDSRLIKIIVNESIKWFKKNQDKLKENAC